MIVTTPGHPFYLEVNVDASSRPAPQGHEELVEPWVGAGDLKVGDKVRQADGTTGIVRIVKAEQKIQTMYNLDVANLDNFYVGEQGWLVHNTNPYSFPGVTYSPGAHDDNLVKQGVHVSINGVEIVFKPNHQGTVLAEIWPPHTSKVGASKSLKYAQELLKTQPGFRYKLYQNAIAARDFFKVGNAKERAFSGTANYLAKGLERMGTVCP